MQQIGYSLIDASGNEVSSYGGNTPGAMQGVHDIALPNGDRVHCPSVGDTYSSWRFVERWINDNPPGPLYARTGQKVAFDGTKVIVTPTYETTPSIVPPTPQQKLAALGFTVAELKTLLGLP